MQTGTGYCITEALRLPFSNSLNNDPCYFSLYFVPKYARVFTLSAWGMLIHQRLRLDLKVYVKYVSSGRVCLVYNMISCYFTIVSIEISHSGTEYQQLLA